MATEQDAARDRVLAARSELADQLILLEASAREAVDIPAKVRRSPAKAAAVAGGVGFVALKGPQRLFGAAKRAVRGKPAPLPESMLPSEIETALRSMGDDGDRIRGVLERDFAKYVKQEETRRRGNRDLLFLALARPLLQRGGKMAIERILLPDPVSLDKRVARLRDRAREQMNAAQARPGSTGDDARTES